MSSTVAMLNIINKSLQCYRNDHRIIENMSPYATVKSHHHVYRLKDMSITLFKPHFYQKGFLKESYLIHHVILFRLWQPPLPLWFLCYHFSCTVSYMPLCAFLVTFEMSFPLGYGRSVSVTTSSCVVR